MVRIGLRRRVSTIEANAVFKPVARGDKVTLLGVAEEMPCGGARDKGSYRGSGFAGLSCQPENK